MPAKLMRPPALLLPCQPAAAFELRLALLRTSARKHGFNRGRLEGNSITNHLIPYSQRLMQYYDDGGILPPDVNPAELYLYPDLVVKV